MYDDLIHETARLEQAGRLAAAARRRTLRPAVAAEQGPAEWVAPQPGVRRWGWGSSDQRARLAFAHGDARETGDGRRGGTDGNVPQVEKVIFLDGVARHPGRETERGRPVDNGVRVVASDRALLLLGHVDGDVTGAPVEGDDPAHVHRFFHADDSAGCRGQGDHEALMTMPHPRCRDRAADEGQISSTATMPPTLPTRPAA